MMRKRNSSPVVLEDQAPPPPPPPAGSRLGTPGGAPPPFTPDPLFLVWLEGLPVQEVWSFHHEYIEPCAARYPATFLGDRCASSAACRRD